MAPPRTAHPKASVYWRMFCSLLSAAAFTLVIAVMLSFLGMPQAWGVAAVGGVLGLAAFAFLGLSIARKAPGASVLPAIPGRR